MQVEQLDDDALLDLAERALAALGARALGGAVEDDSRTDRVERLHRVETIAAAEKLRCIAEVDARGVWRAEGARSTADLLARRLHLTRGQARTQADTAVALEGLPATAAAVRAGEVGIGQAEVAARAAADVHPEVREQLDGMVAADGKGLDRRQLRERVDAWTQQAVPDVLAQRERRVWANRRVSVTSDTPDGSVRGGFPLDPVGGATLIAALDAQSRKTSAADERSYPQRLADALVELAQRALDADDLPQVAAQRPHVICIVHPDGQARLDGVGPVSAATAQMIRCDAEATQVLMTRNHEVLDAGRTRREPTRRQRIAVIARDQVCVGCGAPAARCQVHRPRQPPPPTHPQRTRDHGPTNEDNFCLTCFGCHFNVHHNGWLVIRDLTAAGAACTHPTRWPAGEERAEPTPDPPRSGIPSRPLRASSSLIGRRETGSRSSSSGTPASAGALGSPGEGRSAHGADATAVHGVQVEGVQRARPRGGPARDARLLVPAAA